MSHYEIVKFLIENGADISKSNEYGGNCLINSVTNYKLCKLLLEHGADVNAYDLQNKTPLHYAIHEHNYEVASKLLIGFATFVFIFYLFFCLNHFIFILI